jgi:hypothetical protein
MIDKSNESLVDQIASRTREERNLGYFILTMTVLGLILPIFISPGLDLCFSNLRWLSSLTRLQDLITLNVVNMTEICSLEWLIPLYYVIWIFGMVFFMYLARDAFRQRVVAARATPRKLLTWGFIFIVLFMAVEGALFNSLSKPVQAIYTQMKYMHEFKNFQLAKIILFSGAGIIAASINLFGNFFISTRTSINTSVSKERSKGEARADVVAKEKTGSPARENN